MGPDVVWRRDLPWANCPTCSCQKPSRVVPTGEKSRLHSIAGTGHLGTGSAVEWSNRWSGGCPSHVRFRVYTDQAETMGVPRRNGERTALDARPMGTQ